MIACAVCGVLLRIFMRNNIVTAFILSSVFIPVYIVGYWFFHYIVGGLDMAGFMFLRYYLPSIAYTALFLPVMFIVVRGTEKLFVEE